MIREASIYALRKLSDEERASYGLCVLTMRKWPRGVRRTDINMWVKPAAPSVPLLAEWHAKQIGWETFLARYQTEQEEQETTELVQYHGTTKYTPRVVHVSPVEYLARLAQHQTVTVLCWEQEQCHRFTLVKMIEDRMRVEVAL